MSKKQKITNSIEVRNAVLRDGTEPTMTVQEYAEQYEFSSADLYDDYIEGFFIYQDFKKSLYEFTHPPQQ